MSDDKPRVGEAFLLLRVKEDPNWASDKIQELEGRVAQLETIADDLGIAEDHFGIDYQDEMSTHECLYCDFLEQGDDAVIEHEADCPVLKARALLNDSSPDAFISQVQAEAVDRVASNTIGSITASELRKVASILRADQHPVRPDPWETGELGQDERFVRVSDSALTDRGVPEPDLEAIRAHCANRPNVHDRDLRTEYARWADALNNLITPPKSENEEDPS